MTLRRRIKTGEEQDIHTRLRRWIHLHRDEVAAVKRRTNRRERREGKVESRDD